MRRAQWFLISFPMMLRSLGLSALPNSYLLLLIPKGLTQKGRLKFVVVNGPGKNEAVAQG